MVVPCAHSLLPSLPPSLRFSIFLYMQRRKELEKEAIRAKRGAYQAYDDEEFEGEIGPGAKRKVSARAETKASKPQSCCC